MVENMLLQMAQTGQLRSKLGEDELIGLLERVGSQKSTSVKVCNECLLQLCKDLHFHAYVECGGRVQLN